VESIGSGREAGAVWKLEEIAPHDSILSLHYKLSSTIEAKEGGSSIG
jgi:hypothetical protein